MSPAVVVDTSVSKGVAVSACGAMAVFYVAVLYVPTGLLRMSAPVSREQFFQRRFVCAAVSTAVSVAATFYLLRLGELEGVSAMLHVFGLRSGHLWQAMVIPLSLTSLVYLNSLVCKLEDCTNNGTFRWVSQLKELPEGIASCAVNVMAWRNYVVAPVTEEVVFRACMIPLLLCAGFKNSTIIFFCPMFFSLAHLNHFIELYQGGHGFSRALLIVGFQLGYTVVFGWYAAFLFIRTGTLIAPILAHIFCNYMGLPTFHPSNSRGLEIIAFVAGAVGFLTLLFPATGPNLYHHNLIECNCWQGHCILKQ